MNEINTTNKKEEKNNLEINIKDNKLSQDKNDYLNEVLYFSINQESK